MNAKTKGTSFLPLLVASLAGLAAPASAELFIYEPFDYLSTAPANDGRWFGDATQPYDTGLGLGAWSHRDAAGNGTPNGIAPPNEGDISDQGVTFTDTFGNELPVAGNAYERRIRTGQVAASAPINAAVTAGLTADNSTMWMSFLFQDFGFSGPDFGIGLHSEKMVSDDNQGLEAPGFGVGFGIVSTGGTARNIQTAVYNNSTSATLVPEATPTFDGPGASPVYLLALKVNWNEAGTPDEIFAFIITDLTTEPDETAALAMGTFDFDLATQQSLDVLNFSDTQVGYVDEIRVGTTFADVVGGTSVPAAPFAITDFVYAPGTNEVTLTWAARKRVDYIVKYSTDMTDWGSDVGDGLSLDNGDEVPDDGNQITATFPLPLVNEEPYSELFFRVEEQ